MYACILIRTIPGNVLKVLQVVRGIKGVVKVFPVYGRYDIVAFIEAPNSYSVIKTVEEIAVAKGIRSTETGIEA